MFQNQFTYYRTLGDRTFAQLSDKQLRWQPNPESNSIATIVKHLHGNMLSRWTDFLTTDGEKDFRKRDGEFKQPPTNRREILRLWNEGWDTLMTALGTITAENLNEVVYIRNQGHTVLEAVQRQMMHYAYHVGQIVYLGKQLNWQDWNSLSIPKGESTAYNQAKMAERPHVEHFTEEWLEPEEDEDDHDGYPGHENLGVDFDDFTLMLLEMDDFDGGVYYDRIEQTLVVVHPEHPYYDVMEEELEQSAKIRTLLEAEPNRFGEMDRMVSHESYEIMEKFTERLPKGALQDALYRALSGRRPFRRFKDTLGDLDGEQLKRFYDFKEERRMNHYGRQVWHYQHRADT